MQCLHFKTRIAPSSNSYTPSHSALIFSSDLTMRSDSWNENHYSSRYRAKASRVFLFSSKAISAICRCWSSSFRHGKRRDYLIEGRAWHFRIFWTNNDLDSICSEHSQWSSVHFNELREFVVVCHRRICDSLDDGTIVFNIIKLSCLNLMDIFLSVLRILGVEWE